MEWIDSCVNGWMDEGVRGWIEGWMCRLTERGVEWLA
jgi:hypothetical protein